MIDNTLKKSYPFGRRRKSFPSLLILLVCLGFIALSCGPASDERDRETWIQEIREAEKAFNDMAREEGITEAFLAYAAEDAVILRNDSLYQGRSGLQKYFEQSGTGPEGATLSWTPDFVDVSSSGDLGYTYGSYTYSYVDSSNQSHALSGIFHTVWKRQPDGSWKYVWD